MSRTHDAGLGLPAPVVERLREALLDDAEPRACDALPDGACEVVPGNAGWNVTSGAFSKLGEQLASPGTVLPWILASLGAPAALTGLLVPVKDAGSLLPQLAVAGTLRSRPRRAPWWVGAATVQTVALAAMAAAAAWLGGVAAGAAIVVALAAFSIASGVGSVAFKDVMAKTVPKGGRGRVLAWRSAIGGAAGVAAGLTSAPHRRGREARGPFVALLLAATLCFGLAAAAFARIHERPGATRWARRPAGGTGRPAPPARTARLPRLRDRARAAARGAALAAVPDGLRSRERRRDAGRPGRLRGRQRARRQPGQPRLGPLRRPGVAPHDGGRRPDRGRGRRMGVPGGRRARGRPNRAHVRAGLPSGGRGLRRRAAGAQDLPGRRAPRDERPTYVATSNTAIGVATLVGAAIGAVAAVVGAGWALVTFAALTVVGAASAWRLPPADRMHVPSGDAQ